MTKTRTTIDSAMTQTHRGLTYIEEVIPSMEADNRLRVTRCVDHHPAAPASTTTRFSSAPSESGPMEIEAGYSLDGLADRLMSEVPPPFSEGVMEMLATTIPSPFGGYRDPTPQESVVQP
jgi:hypothetical protein